MSLVVDSPIDIRRSRIMIRLSSSSCAIKQ